MSVVPEDHWFEAERVSGTVKEDFWGKELTDKEIMCQKQVGSMLRWLGKGQVRKLDFI